MQHTANSCASIPLLAQITRLRFTRGHVLLHASELHPGQYYLLMLLGKSEGLSQREIASHLLIKPSTLTVMIKRLMKNELIERKKDPHDGRILRVYITVKGRHVLEEATQKFAQIEEETFAGFSSEDRLKFESLGLQIRDNLLKALGGEDHICQWY
ncbi:MAG: MarR family transcriptional regulator [Sphaerochaetaceae bacterium]|jgi:DNA-binding MarR family transcriptional regulator|nr:MarR family transcriptional regulator [Sphaerochaetaceae bacterium]